jgi:hypothetical protein
LTYLGRLWFCTFLNSVLFYQSNLYVTGLLGDLQTYKKNLHYLQYFCV